MEGVLDGPTIRVIRRRLGITQRELGERLNVDQGTVSRWERGVEIPRPARQAALRSLLLRDEERRHLNRSLAVVRHNLRPATLLDRNLRLLEMSASGELIFRKRGQDPSKLLGITFDRYLDRIGNPEMWKHVQESGLLTGDALLFLFTVNARGSGNTIVWEPILEDGELIGVLNYVSHEFAFPANQEFTIEHVGFVPADDPARLITLHRGKRASHVAGPAAPD
ncbi:Helix-turn-helix [Rhodovulum sp. ES.010]|uniref:helix-turn-helix domain-containing protein n=1 Tax=Rhodovulum sp. ES.010 TaxID=1882821 RepID=UPI000926B111|nr:helix-turn-helix domain-containing protein [Rhodovulum sp. ES.010]SIO42534.1 Helix-turn-helix [Rhodovulum sp. ES.010]